MSLNPLTGADLATAAVQAQINKAQSGEAIKTPAEMAQDLAAAYHAYAKAGTLAGADLASGGDVTILESAFVSDNSTAVPAQIAQGICDYWSSINTAGTPSHGGTSVVSVVIDGESLVSAMESAIRGVTSGGWPAFFSVTDAVVKTIPCTITELMPTTPPTQQTFQEYIS